MKKRNRLLLTMLLATASMAFSTPAIAGTCSADAQIDPASLTVLDLKNGQSTKVKINGTPSSPKEGKDGATYTWVQLPGGPTVTIYDAETAQPYFYAPNVGPDGAVLTFKLTVSGCSPVQTSTKTITVNVRDAQANQPPVAQATASAYTVNEGEEVTLDGSTSYDPDGNPITSYLWEQVIDTNNPTTPVIIKNPNSVSTTFTAPLERYPYGETLKFRLTVSDGNLSGTSEILITVNSVNLPPTASITCPGPVKEGDQVTLDSEGSSDPDLGPLTYLWGQDTGVPNADFTNIDLTTASIQFTAPKLENCYPNDTLKFGLTVTDNGNLSALAKCDVKILDMTPPVFDSTTIKDITAEATSSAGAAVTFDNLKAYDAFYPDNMVTITCDPASGSTFAIDATTSKTTVVNCSASDGATPPNTTAPVSFKVTVQDTTPPALTLPSSIGPIEGNTLGGANNITYSASAEDKVDGSVLVTCTPASSASLVFSVGTTAVNCSAIDAHGNQATGSFNVTVKDTTPPKFDPYSPPASTYATSASGAIVTYTNPTASDIVDGVVNPICSPASGSTFPLGTTTVSCTATDTHNNGVNMSFSVSVIYNWTGFFQPVDNWPAMNGVKAGSAVPVKFSLGGNMGLNIFSSGYPRSVPLVDNSPGSNDIEETLNAGGSSLTYDALANQYIYVWKTEKSWTGTSRQLQIKLADGTTQIANFKFK